MSDLAKPARGALVRSVAHKELREIARDGRLWMVAATLAALLVVALAFGLRHEAAVRAERAAAQAAADDHFRAQDDKNPHVAAHYGTYVFKPGGALAFIDPGVEPFVGVSIKLQAHQRGAPRARARPTPPRWRASAASTSRRC
jgi:ABC-2 type transport system permease protein